MRTAHMNSTIDYTVTMVFYSDAGTVSRVNCSVVPGWLFIIIIIIITLACKWTCCCCYCWCSDLTPWLLGSLPATISQPQRPLEKPTQVNKQHMSAAPCRHTMRPSPLTFDLSS